MKIVIFTCDIIDSRKNIQLMEGLSKKIIKLNELLKDSLITKINISRGDEVQFILKLDREFFKNIMLFRAILYPLQIRIGASITDNNSNFLTSKNSWDLNGEPFFLAREIIDIKLKREKKTCIYFNSKTKEFDFILNSFFGLNDIIINKWRDSQWKLVEKFLQIQDKKVLASIFNLKVTEEKISATLYDRLKRLAIEEINESEKELLNLFEKRGLLDDE